MASPLSFPQFYSTVQNCCYHYNLPTLPITSTKQFLSQQQILHHRRLIFSPKTPNKKPILNRFVKVKSQLNFPLIPSQDHWGTWTVLFATGAFGIWSEKTKLGGMLSGAVVSTLLGLMASNVGIISFEAPAYSIVMEYLLQIAVPLLLFKADLQRVIRSTGTLLVAFLIGSVGTMIGTIVAYQMVPMRSIGQDSWKIAAALMSSYIGGSNFTPCCIIY